MSDLIDRQTAIDALDEQIERCDKSLSSLSISMMDEYAVKVERASLAAFRETLEYLPSTQPEQRWIPVSERLPENFQRVLVTVVNYKGDKVVRVAEYHDRNCVFQIKENYEQWEVGEKGLLAWTPMPEPYKQKMRERNDTDKGL